MMKSCSDLMRMIKSAEGMTRMVQLYGSREGEVAARWNATCCCLSGMRICLAPKKCPYWSALPDAPSCAATTPT